MAQGGRKRGTLPNAASTGPTDTDRIIFEYFLCPNDDDELEFMVPCSLKSQHYSPVWAHCKESKTPLNCCFTASQIEGQELNTEFILNQVIH